ncbi:THO complex subunit 1 isoform X2 [Lutzomyia longipalpis]|uniref:THO complex subunit 1 isoform X2 n=1 Tax=Lutzomyia longipalpis TaxID=7200 RepID=UPI0024843D09|nr:THO complex subunit 1 isoform X2 [Lutzomyia longipalpis]
MCTPTFQIYREQLTEILRKSFKERKFEKLEEDFKNLGETHADKKSSLDQVFRDVLLLDLAKDIKAVEDYITFASLAARADMVSVTIPVILLGDVFDAVTLDQCEQLFTYVENNVSVWKEEVFFAPCKNNILRMCNDLLRRLSRSQNTVFCGRILLFLAKFFPFSERSGLNIVSEFNLENLTEYSTDGKNENLAGDSVETQLQIDYNLYCKFWALQDFFRNPNQCYNKVQWKTFVSHTSTVLAAFKGFKLEEPRQGGSREKSEAMDVDEINEQTMLDPETGVQHFFAKFLTNPKLLALQLSDSNFRRSVLVQFLILFHYLPSQVKFKMDVYTLTVAQVDWIKETETLVYKLLDETPPNGQKFSKSVQHMLQREEMWNNWKNEGCKEFQRPDPHPSDTGKAPSSQRKHKRLLGDSIKEATKHGKFYMGNPELTKLWNLCPDNLQACKGSDRNFLPSLESYLDNPKDKNDPSYEWRALRLMARQSPHFFTLFNTPSYKVSDYVESVRKKIQKDRTEAKQEPLEEVLPVVEQMEADNFADEQEQIEADLLKTEQLTPEDKNNHKPNMITGEQLQELAPIIGSDWKKLASKLGYRSDEILFFETENPTASAQCHAMLQIWFDDDMDASLDNLAYILEGLGMLESCETVKKFIGNIDLKKSLREQVAVEPELKGKSMKC